VTRFHREALAPAVPGSESLVFVGRRKNSESHQSIRLHNLETLSNSNPAM
jgi:hypothetical protein